MPTPGSNRFNVRGNIDFQVNDFISSSLDVVSMISTHQNRPEQSSAGRHHPQASHLCPAVAGILIDTLGNETLADR